jgi:hypothetical protein
MVGYDLDESLRIILSTPIDSEDLLVRWSLIVQTISHLNKAKEYISKPQPQPQGRNKRIKSITHAIGVSIKGAERAVDLLNALDAKFDVLQKVFTNKKASDVLRAGLDDEGDLNLLKKDLRRLQKPSIEDRIRYAGASIKLADDCKRHQDTIQSSKQTSFLRWDDSAEKNDLLVGRRLSEFNNLLPGSAYIAIQEKKRVRLLTDDAVPYFVEVLRKRRSDRMPSTTYRMLDLIDNLDKSFKSNEAYVTVLAQREAECKRTRLYTQNMTSNNVSPEAGEDNQDAGDERSEVQDQSHSLRTTDTDTSPADTQTGAADQPAEQQPQTNSVAGYPLPDTSGPIDQQTPDTTRRGQTLPYGQYSNLIASTLRQSVEASSCADLGASHSANLENIATGASHRATLNEDTSCQTSSDSLALTNAIAFGSSNPYDTSWAGVPELDPYDASWAGALGLDPYDASWASVPGWNSLPQDLTAACQPATTSWTQGMNPECG